MSGPTPPRVTAVVVVHGAPQSRIEACLGSLVSSHDVDLEVVVVDNGSPDGGAAVRAASSAWPNVTPVCSERNGGFAAGVNIGLQRRRAGDAVWLLNDDATIAPNTISTCSQTLLAHGPSCVAVAPKMLLADEPDRIDAVGTVLRANGEAFNAGIGQPDLGQYSDGEVVFGPCFGAALFRADAFDADVVGLLDERYFLYYEDIDWNIRAFHRGLVTVAATQAVVWHQHATSTRRLGEGRRYSIVQRNLLLCVTTNFPVRDALRIWVQRMIVHGKGLITGPYRGARVRALSSAFVGLPGALRARRSARTGPRLDDPAMFRFAEDQVPYFDAETYRSSRPDEADEAARRRQ